MTSGLLVVVVRRDAIDRELAAVLTTLDNHQLALIEARMLLALAFEREADRFPARLTSRASITCRFREPRRADRPIVLTSPCGMISSTTSLQQSISDAAHPRPRSRHNGQQSNLV